MHPRARQDTHEATVTNAHTQRVCAETHRHTNCRHLHNTHTEMEPKQANPTNLTFSSDVNTCRHTIFYPSKSVSENQHFLYSCLLAYMGVILDPLIWAYWVVFVRPPAIFFLVGCSRFIARSRHQSMDREQRSESRKEGFCHCPLQYSRRVEVCVCVSTCRLLNFYGPSIWPCVSLAHNVSILYYPL